MNGKYKRIVFLALMVSIALVLHIVESGIPALVFIVPGLRLGLANIVSVVMIYRFRVSEALGVLVLRILMASIFAGGVSMFLYSISGGLLSFVVMLLVKKFNFLKLSVSGVSMLGAIFFNVGQLIVAAIMIETLSIMAYLPVMGIASILTGFFVGLVSKYLIERESLWKQLG